MTLSAPPRAALSILPKADGSASYSYAAYTATASVNGPIEAQRRDEHPYEALVDILVRPASGVGGTRERHLESLLQKSLRQLILVKDFPRCVIQIVLQVTCTPVNDHVNTKLAQPSSDLLVIPALFQAAILALLSAAVPMRAIATCAVAAISRCDGKARVNLSPCSREAEKASSVHVLAFTSHDELLLAESRGDFTMGEWEAVYDAAQRTCCASPTRGGTDTGLDEGQQQQQQTGPDMRQFVRSVAEAKVMADLGWK